MWSLWEQRRAIWRRFNYHVDPKPHQRECWDLVLEWEVRRLQGAALGLIQLANVSRKEYVRHVSARAVLKNIHCRDVHQRRNDHEEFWLSRKVALANRAETRRLEEGERRKKEKENEEKVISERKWMVLTSLCYRMEFIRDQLRKNQMLRAEFTRRKGAAVRIATWFKAILVESRKKDLLNACIKLQKFTAPIMVEKKKRAREACAERLYNFLEQLKDSSQISLAVRRFKQLMVVIQRAWRGFCSVRAAQRLLLSKQFQRFETSLLKYNHKTNKKQPRRSTKRKAAPLSRSMFFHPADVVDPRPSGKKKVCPMNSLGAFENSTNTKGAQLKVKPKDEDKPDYERLLTLAALMMRIPKNIKAQVIDEQLVKETGHFHERLEQHHRDKRVYLTQKPIDEVRLKLLRDAGFKATPQVLPPKVPRLRVLQNVTGLQTMMQRAIQLVQEEQISAQRRNEDNLMQSILNLENL
ncbi:hypothetical protein BSKO_03374 [Bryopsis sp. KO-2023]|nr:hypothetical protein BSKO_03374 [Bryopsis sp. KO-2023]